MKAVVVRLLTAYKQWISPVMPPSCRFVPTCSEYARLAVIKHGVLVGLWRSGGRLLRCQPFHPGGVDLP